MAKRNLKRRSRGKSKSGRFPDVLYVKGPHEDNESPFDGDRTVEAAVSESDELIHVAVYKYVREDVYTVSQVWEPKKVRSVERFEYEDGEDDSSVRA